MNLLKTKEVKSNGGSSSINKNKIVLINPPGRILVKPDGTIGERKHCTPPLGLAYLAANLRKAKYEVEGIDMLAEGYETERLRDQTIIYGLTIDETVERIRKANPILIGIGVLFSARAAEAFKLGEAIRKKLPHIKILYGGQHLSGMPLQNMKNSFIDFVIQGEADESIVQLMDSLNGHLPINQVTGLFHRENGVVKDNMDGIKPVVVGKGWKYYRHKEAPIPHKIDELPFPAWDLFPMEKYWASEVRFGLGDITRERFAIVQSTRGCPHVCSFCTSPLLSGYKAYRRRSVDHVIEEIHWLKKTYNIEEIQFMDDNFFVSVPRVKKLCKRLIEEFPDLVFSAPGGAEVNSLDDELIDLLAKTNFHKLMLAIEAGSEEIQEKRVDKKVKLHRVPHVIQTIRDKGMTTHGLFMIGFPDETKEQMDRTINFAKSLDLDDFSILIVTPLPGTPLYDECMDRDLLLEGFDINDLCYGNSNIKLRDVHTKDVERLRRETWLDMKNRKMVSSQLAGTKMHGAHKQFKAPEEYEKAGLKIDPSSLKKQERI